jgi:predicted transglutaminase-like cysteine proteinase
MSIKNCEILIVCTMCILLSETNQVTALEEDYVSHCKNLLISQDRYQKGSILISQPSTIDKEFRELVIFENIKNLDDYIYWLKKTIKYKSDGTKDNWADPQETLRKKYGDCEDLAFLNAAFLHAVGFQTKVLGIIMGLGGNHAICVFKEKNYYSWIDNTELKRTQAESILQFTKYITSRYGCLSVRELKLQKHELDKAVN